MYYFNRLLSWRNLRFKLQPSLKKILLANGFDNSYVISKINESDISSNEDFARNTLPDLISESQYEEYYGIFKIKYFQVQISRWP